MKKSSLVPLIVIVATFLVIPIVFWALTFKKTDENIQGARTKIGAAGVLVKINSTYGTWDMAKYLCKTRDECLESLVSGKILETTSGGGVEDQFVSVRYTKDWDSYEFLKMFVKPGWGSSVRKFYASLTENISRSFVENFTYNGMDYEVVIVPVKGIGDTLLEVAKFSDSQ